MLDILAQTTQDMSDWEWIGSVVANCGELVKILVSVACGAGMTYWVTVRADRKIRDERETAELPAFVLGCLEECQLDATRNMRVDLSVRYHHRAEELYAAAARKKCDLLKIPGFPESWESARREGELFQSAHIDSGKSLATAYKGLLTNLGRLRGLHRKDKLRLPCVDEAIKVVDAFDPNKFAGFKGYGDLGPSELEAHHRKAQLDAGSFVQSGLVRPIRAQLKKAGWM